MPAPGTIDEIQAAERLCFFAHYDQDDVVAAHVLLYLAALRDAGFAIVLVSTSRLPPDQIEAARAFCLDVVCRDNSGHDFGSWIAAVARYFPIRAELLLLANDSVYAPVGDLSAFIDRLLATPADAYGAFLSGAPAPHVQSWFVLLRPAAYRSTGFAELMGRPMRALESKWDLILTYEVGLTQALLREGLTVVAALDDRSLGRIAARTSFNVMHVLWRQVIDRGVPFLKVELLRVNPVRVRHLDRWREVVADRRPDLAAAVAADLARRGQAPAAPARNLMTWEQRMYWPEVRFLLARGIERPASPLRDRWDHALFVAITTATAPWRKVRRRLSKR